MSTLITEEYRQMQATLHQNPNYGVASVQYAPTVAEILKQIGPTELLDYGAGKGRLGETLQTLMLNPPQIRQVYEPLRTDGFSGDAPGVLDCGPVASQPGAGRASCRAETLQGGNIAQGPEVINFQDINLPSRFTDPVFADSFIKGKEDELCH